MPELPEVELARRTLARVLERGRITAARSDDRLVSPGAPGSLEPLVGARAVAVERRGKQLRIALAAPSAGGASLLVFAHLGMTGEWHEAKTSAPPLRHEKVRVDVGARSLRYTDPRRLGRFVVAKEDTKAWRALGPDALADGVDAKALHAKLAKRRRTVKEALLDQKILAGIGNILAIEGLWRAKLDPRSRADRLTLADVRALAKGLRDAIAFQLRQLEKATEPKYVNMGGENPFRIYGRAGKPCPRCKHTLAKIVLGGRGTTFCPSCQRRI
jgi:formamidopyrimidine-DNA glycosylase